MHIQVGCELTHDCPQPTPMILMLKIHTTRLADIVVPDEIVCEPAVPVTSGVDGYGNRFDRVVAPTGRSTVSARAVVFDRGWLDPVVIGATQHAVEALPAETLPFLLPSRFCESDTMQAAAWSLFAHTPPGWPRVQAICDFVHAKIAFGYEHARVTKSAWQVLNEGKGVCRDYAHLAIVFCRCLNIPARYCTGFLSDIDQPPPYAPMDFAAWFEVYLGGAWHTFDPRNNTPRRGRILMARGRDAADVAIATTFGPNTLVGFRVWTDEVPGT